MDAWTQSHTAPAQDADNFAVSVTDENLAVLETRFEAQAPDSP